jgi:hypothetical protein
MTGAVDLRSLFFDDSAGAAEAMTAALFDHPGGDMGGTVRALPEVARKAALTRLTEAATGLLEQDVTEVFCTGWQKHTALLVAAKDSLTDPDAKRRVGLATHAISFSHEPAVELHADNRKLAELKLGIKLEVVVKGLQAVIQAGRLVAVEAGTCDVDATLTIAGATVAHRPMSLPLPLTVRLGEGWPLVPGV